VSGYEGKEVIVEANGAIAADTESGNGIVLKGPMNSGLRVRVPYSTSLKLDATNGGGIRIDRVNGDLELNNMNGGVFAYNVTGPIVAHSLNGRVEVSFDKVSDNKPSSLSSLNGSIDLYLPTDARATLHMKTDNGSINSDFDMRLAPGVYGRGKVTTATVNNGGADVTIKTFNGSIHLRKK
jgi:DUF4097 and DUF4098 domain-containing protein YvlB